MVVNMYEPQCFFEHKDDESYRGEVDKPDFNLLITNHGKYVKCFISKRLKVREDIEDVYQITLLEAFKSYKNFRGDSHSRTWLCGVANNVIRNYIRKNFKGAVYFSDDIEMLSDLSEFNSDDYSVTYHNPEAFYEYVRFSQGVINAMESLPCGMREVFKTVVEDGLSYEDASLRHQIPIGTVRSRISRARAIMKNVRYG